MSVTSQYTSLLHKFLFSLKICTNHKCRTNMFTMTMKSHASGTFTLTLNNNTITIYKNVYIIDNILLHFCSTLSMYKELFAVLCCTHGLQITFVIHVLCLCIKLFLITGQVAL